MAGIRIFTGSCGKNWETTGSGTRCLSGNLGIPFAGSHCFLPESAGIGGKSPEKSDEILSGLRWPDSVAFQRFPAKKVVVLECWLFVSGHIPSGYGEFVTESGFNFLVNSGRNTTFSRGSSGQRICPDVTGSCLWFPAGIRRPRFPAGSSRIRRPESSSWEFTKSMEPSFLRERA